MQDFIAFTLRHSGYYTLICLGLIATASGCGGASDDTPELAAVTGKVTMDSQPLAKAVVSFYPTAGGIASFGNTNDQGEYELTFNNDNKGAILGAHTVKITIMTENPSDPETIPAKYNENSELTANVEADGNEINFELTSK